MARAVGTAGGGEEAQDVQIDEVRSDGRMRAAAGHRPEAGGPDRSAGRSPCRTGSASTKKVIAFCDDSDVEAAKKAGAIEAGCDELIKKVIGRLDGLRRGHRLAEGHGQGRQARPRARSAGQDAFAEERHGDGRYRDGRGGVRGRARWNSATTPAATSMPWSAS